MEEEHMAMEPVETNEFRGKLKRKLMETNVLNAFTKLTSDKAPVRLKGSVLLLKHLTLSNDDKRDTEYTYALDRLVRGVGSSRKNAKTGNFAALVALLAKTAQISTQNVLDAIKKHLVTSGSSGKSEIADTSMGKILVCGALIHANRFIDANSDEQKQIVEILFTAGKKKSFLNLAAFTFVFELVETVNEEQFKTMWEIIKPEVAKPWKEQNIDSIYLLCLVRDKYPGIVKNKFIKKNLEVPEIIHEDSAKHLCEMMMTPLCLATLNHPIYSYISQRIAKSDQLPKWCSQIDAELLKSNRKKLLVAISMFTTMLDNLLDHSNIPEILTPQFIIAILHYFKIKNLRDQDPEFLYKIDKFFLSLTTALESESVTSKIKMTVIKKLLFYPGNFIFEKITGTKLIQQIIGTIDTEGVKKVAKMYRDVVLASKPRIVSETQTEYWVNLDRNYAASLLIKLLANKSVQKESEWRLDQIKFLLKLGMFKESGESSVGVELASSLRDAFYHSLDQKLPKLEDLRSLLSSIVHFINDTIFTDMSYELRTALPVNGPEIWAEMMGLIKKLEAKQKPNFIVPVFHTLLLQMGLLLFKDFEMAQNALKELHTCYNKIQSEKNTKKGKSPKKIDDTEPEWIEVVIDLFLSLLSYNSHLLRNIVSCVFPFLCPHLTMHALRQILDVLDPKNEDNPLIKSRHESSDEDWSSDDDEPKLENEEESEESEESEDSGLEDTQNDEEESSMDKLRLAVRSALHKQGYKTDDESEDIDKMDEDIGKKLDAALASAFKLAKKSHKGKKNKQTRDDKTLTHFRIRVLDLIEQYFNSEPSMQQALEIVTLLLQTLEFSVRDVHQKPLEIRLRNCLKKLSNIKKFSALDMTDDALADTLTSILEKGTKSAFIYQDMGDVISECCIFVLRCSQMIQTNSPKKKVSKLEKIFQDSLQVYFKNRDCLLPLVLFKDVIQISWEGNWSLLPILVNSAFETDVRLFRRSQALELLRLFYTNKRFRIENVEEFKLKIAPIEAQISIKSIELLNGLIEDLSQAKVREKSFCCFVNLLLVVKKANASSNMDWATIGATLQTYKAQVSLARDAKSACNTLFSAIGINSVKRQIKKLNGQEIQNGEQPETSVDELETIKKRKKTIKNDRQKMKKEATLLRIKAGAEGLENEIAFSAVSLAAIKAQDEVSEVSENEETKIEKKKIKKLKKKKSKVSNDSSDDEIEHEKVNQKKMKKKTKKGNTNAITTNGILENDDGNAIKSEKVEKMRKTANILENGANKRYNSESDERPKKQKRVK